MQQLLDLADTVRNRYGYNIGSPNVKNELNVNRLVVKLDWNPNTKNKFTISYRFNDGERIAAQSQNGSTSMMSFRCVIPK